MTFVSREPSPLRFDLTLPGPIELIRRRLRLDGETLSFGSKRLRLADVETVAYETEVVKQSGIHTLTLHYFAATGLGAAIKLQFTIGVVSPRRIKEKRTHAFATLVEASRTLIEPRLRQLALDRLRDGESVRVGSLTLSRDAFEGPSSVLHRSKSFDWTAFRGTRIEQAVVYVAAVARDGNELELRSDLRRPNTILLPELLAACQAEFAVRS